jgi:hypothetical protein
MAGVLHLLKPDASPLAAPVITAMQRESEAPVTVVLSPAPWRPRSLPASPCAASPTEISTTPPSST